MLKIAIVSDSSISLTPEEIKQTGVYIAPLTIISNNIEYLDQIDITTEGVNAMLRENKVVTTSQPNLGYMINLFESLKEKEYDHIYCLPVTRHLSGTHRTFVQAKDEVGLQNMTVVDTQSLVGPIQRMIYAIIDLNKEGKSIDEINEKLDYYIDNNESFLLPKDLKQLKASGRISPAASTMASLLRIRAILKLENKGETIDKFATARSQNKSYDIVIEDLIKHDVKPDTHYLNFLHCDGKEDLDLLKDRIETKLGHFDSHTSVLPSSLATHAGIGTIAVQWTKK